MFILLMAVGIWGGWHLSRRISGFRATLPELSKTIATLNASILHAEAMICELQSAARTSADTPASPNSGRTASRPPDAASQPQLPPRAGLARLRPRHLKSL